MTLPTDLKYAATHEWVREADNGDLVVGITDYAQDQLGDVVYVEIPTVGTKLNAGEACMLLESVKAASDIYMPVSGVVSAVNTALEDSPELINDDAFDEGWLFQLTPDAAAETTGLLSAADYDAALDE